MVPLHRRPWQMRDLAACHIIFRVALRAPLRTGARGTDVADVMSTPVAEVALPRIAHLTQHQTATKTTIPRRPHTRLRSYGVNSFASRTLGFFVFTRHRCSLLQLRARKKSRRDRRRSARPCGCYVDRVATRQGLSASACFAYLAAGQPGCDSAAVESYRIPPANKGSFSRAEGFLL